MLKTLGIVQACVGSPRFRCNLQRKLWGQSLLGWVVRRVTDSLRLDGVIVVARGPADDRSIANLVPADVPVCVSCETDAVSRFLSALEDYPAEAVVRIRGDNAFVDPSLIDRLVATADSYPDCDYVSFCSHDGRPAIHSPIGICAEWFRARALRRVAEKKLNIGSREYLTRYIYSHPETFNVRLIPIPSPLDRDDVRLTVDMEEDWENALAIFEALGPDRMEWQRIANLLDQQPGLRRRMEALNRVYSPS